MSKRVGVILYADDSVLLSPTLDGQQEMIKPILYQAS